eukprot:5868024-Heterocapsa_arctica.AAC.1
MDFTYGIEDLGRLVWSGEHKIPTSLASWKLILSRMRIQLSGDELGTILYNKMAESKELK